MIIPIQWFTKAFKLRIITSLYEIQCGMSGKI